MTFSRVFSQTMMCVPWQENVLELGTSASVSTKFLLTYSYLVAFLEMQDQKHTYLCFEGLDHLRCHGKIGNELGYISMIITMSRINVINFL